MSNVVKGIKKGFKTFANPNPLKTHKYLHKKFKKVSKKKWFKAVAVVAAAVFAWWAIGAASAAGGATAAASSGSAAATAGGSAAAAGGGTSWAALGQAAAASGTSSGISAGTVGTAASTAGSVASGVSEAAKSKAAGELAKQTMIDQAKKQGVEEVKKGFFRKAYDSIGKETIKASILQGVSSMFTPDETDMMQMGYDRQDEERERRNRNLEDAGNIQFDMPRGIVGRQAAPRRAPPIASPQRPRSPGMIGRYQG